MMREDWGVGGAIKVVFSFLEESYELTSSMRSHAYGLGEEPDLRISTSQQPSIRFVLSSREEMGVRHHSIIRFAPSTYREKNPSFTATSIRHFIYFRDMGKWAAWVLQLREAWRFTQVVSPFLPFYPKCSREREKQTFLIPFNRVLLISAENKTRRPLRRSDQIRYQETIFISLLLRLYESPPFSIFIFGQRLPSQCTA